LKLNKSIFRLFLILIFCCACNKDQKRFHRVQNVKDLPEEEFLVRPDFDLQGHRGARGLMPENSIPAFLLALDLGVNTLEMDVVISQDKQVVVSHEPFFSAEISLTEQGDTIKPEDEKKYNIYEMTLNQIRKFDCGSRGNERFPEQKKQKVHKPALSEVVQAVEQHIKTRKLKEVYYNIEIKSKPETDSIFHPKPAEFASLLHQSLKDLKILDRVFIQSFDVRALQSFKKINQEVPLVFLVENKLSLAQNLKKLGFTPSVYSPYFELLSAEEVRKAHDLGMKVIPWTVNEIADMKRIQRMGVDGLITDYPNRFKELK
jgi:glycerophosphoryl diester phosphodiesterase